jgi:hypothetical protein
MPVAEVSAVESVTAVRADDDASKKNERPYLD